MGICLTFRVGEVLGKSCCLSEWEYVSRLRLAAILWIDAVVVDVELGVDRELHLAQVGLSLALESVQMAQSIEKQELVTVASNVQ